MKNEFSWLSDNYCLRQLIQTFSTRRVNEEQHKRHKIFNSESEHLYVISVFSVTSIQKWKCSSMVD